jgi:ABC-type polar amino acid transport system ATPase subunit
MRGVVKNFGPFIALDKVNLDLACGEKLVICGPSGSGKSTLIRCINRLEEPDAGTITIAGVAPRDLQGLRQKVGMVFQQFNLFPNLNCRENIAVAPRKLLGLSRGEADVRAETLLERVQLSGHADKLPAQLSGGQQQRVAIARALAMEPVLMLFDEPTSALDPEMIREVLEVMMELGRGGMSMIVVTHEMGFARRAADRVAFMDQGQIVAIASPQQFFEVPPHPRLVRFLDNILGH